MAGVAKGVLTLAEKAKGALDMAHDARMSRAREMGFDTDRVWYHGTTKDFEAFQPRTTRRGKEVPLFFSPDPDVANQFSNAEYLNSLGPNRAGDDAAQVIPALLSTKNTFDFRNPDHVELLRGRVPEQKIGPIENGEFQALESAETMQAMKDLGFDSFHVMEGSRRQSFVDADRSLSEVFPDTPEGRDAARKLFEAKKSEWEQLGMGLDRAKPEIEKVDGGFAIRHQGNTFSNDSARRQATINTAVFDPANIRSINAAFDPAKKDSANLLAGVGGLGVLTGAMMPSEEASAAALVDETSGTYGLGQVGERAYSVATTGRHTPATVSNINGSPALLQFADTLEDYTQSPLGGSHLQGVVDLLRKYGYREQATPWDYASALLDVAP